MGKRIWLAGAFLMGAACLCAMDEATYFYTYEKEIEGLSAPVVVEVRSVRPLRAGEMEDGWQRLAPVLIRDLTASGYL